MPAQGAKAAIILAIVVFFTIVYLIVGSFVSLINWIADRWRDHYFDAIGIKKNKHRFR